MLKLKFTDGRQPPLWVVEKNFTIGRASDNTLVIDDASVSPRHAKITDNALTIILKDLDSEQGSKVNGKSINQQAITYHDTVTFGEVELTIIDPTTEERAHPWALIGSSGFLAGQEFALPAQENRSVVIGRGKRCDIPFAGTQLSKEHAKLTPTAEGLMIEDLASTNGVFVNDERIPKALLQPGDKLRLDIYNFRVFGPALKLSIPPAGETPNNATPDNPAAFNPATATAPQKTPSNKQWITRPTSPGNRLEAASDSCRLPLSMIFFSVVMVIMLVGFSVYLFL